MWNISFSIAWLNRVEEETRGNYRQMTFAAVSFSNIAISKKSKSCFFSWEWLPRGPLKSSNGLGPHTMRPSIPSGTHCRMPLLPEPPTQCLSENDFASATGLYNSLRLDGEENAEWSIDRVHIWICAHVSAQNPPLTTIKVWVKKQSQSIVKKNKSVRWNLS